MLNPRWIKTANGWQYQYYDDWNQEQHALNKQCVSYLVLRDKGGHWAVWIEDRYYDEEGDYKSYSWPQYYYDGYMTAHLARLQGIRMMGLEQYDIPPLPDNIHGVQ